MKYTDPKSVMDAIAYLEDKTKPQVSPMPSLCATGHRNALVEGLFTVCAWLITLATGLALLVIFAVLAGFVCALIGKAFMLAAGWLFR